MTAVKKRLAAERSALQKELASAAERTAAEMAALRTELRARHDEATASMLAEAQARRSATRGKV